MGSETTDVLIIGGGVIGLSLAWELAQRQTRVVVVERGELGREASWAGAGMIPSGPAQTHWHRATPVEQLAGLSCQLHPQWSVRLLEETGIDNQFRRCGTLRLAETPTDIEHVESQVARWEELGIECLGVDAVQLADLEPELSPRAAEFPTAYLVPGETQIRNPRHVRALAAACRAAGVDLITGTEVRELKTRGERLSTAVTDAGTITADQYCLAAGCWTGQLAAQLGLRLPVKPMRGQIVLLRGETMLLSRNIYVGLRYLTPRADGRVLVGSTIEDAGFEKQNTPSATTELLAFAAGLAPSLAQLPVETCWSGLRPGTPDGKPYLGRAGEVENLWVATGHFRAGLQLSPGTAVVMASLLRGEAPAIDVTSLGTER